ncbi:MAG: caspase family protein [Alphaproteobacteria bacterium]|nr:caspase family protein [Alphaproteobacteria bacterium]
MILSLALGVALTDASAATQRFALLAGANDGGPDRVTLRYAVSDAEAVAEVLQEMGGVRPTDTLLLVEPDRQELDAGLSQLAAMVEDARASGDRAEVVIYYSGHSDEHGLLLGGTRYPYDELRGTLDTIPADVRVVVVDACASGALVRGKGGVHRPPFLVDESVEVTGYAYLTSASADEAAQEADRIQGSYFTQALISGLRGGADASGDRRVTLNEAYQFAYTETLSATERTLGGAQHANYDIRLAGTGDLVMTDLSSTGAVLAFGADLEGRLTIRDDEGHLVAELVKPAGRPLELGLAAGRYRIMLDDGRLREAEVILSKGDTLNLTRADFVSVPVEVTAMRGGAPVDEPWFGLTIVPPVTFAAGQGVPGRAIDLALGVALAEQVNGAQVSVVGSITTGDVRGVQLAAAFATAAGMRGLQAAPALALVYGPAEGLQAGAGMALSQSLRGVQLAGGLSIAGSMRGLQSAGGITVAGDMKGVQGAPINIAKQMDGVQLGVVNIGGEVDGAQIGVINVARDVDGPVIGILSFHANGYNSFQLSASEADLANVGFTYGGKRLYTLLQFGYYPNDDDARFNTWLGFGVHTPMQRLYVDVDASAGQAQSIPFVADTQALAVRVRGLVGLRVIDPIAIYAGPSLNMLAVQFDGPTEYPTRLPKFSMGAGDAEVPWWIGLTIGARFGGGRPAELLNAPE